MCRFQQRRLKAQAFSGDFAPVNVSAGCSTIQTSLAESEFGSYLLLDAWRERVIDSEDVVAAVDEPLQKCVVQGIERYGRRVISLVVEKCRCVGASIDVIKRRSDQVVVGVGTQTCFAFVYEKATHRRVRFVLSPIVQVQLTNVGFIELVGVAGSQLFSECCLAAVDAAGVGNVIDTEGIEVEQQWRHRVVFWHQFDGEQRHRREEERHEQLREGHQEVAERVQSALHEHGVKLLQQQEHASVLLDVAVENCKPNAKPIRSVTESCNLKITDAAHSLGP